MSAENDRKMWHDAFYSGIKLELRKYRDVLEYSTEQTIGKEPLIVDMIIIKKYKDAVIENEIGRIFRERNIIEFKSPEDGLTIDDFFKTLGYAMFYKSLSEKVNDIRFEELTVSLVRDVYPRELIKELKRLGAAVEERYSGVYYVDGIIKMPVQIVVTGKLRSIEHSWLKVISNRAGEEDVLHIMSDAEGFTEQGEQQNASAVFDVSAAANDDLFTRIRSVIGMKENAFFDIFYKDKAEKMAAEREAIGRAEGEAKGRKEGKEEGIAEGEAKGIAKGIAKGRAERESQILSVLRELGASEEMIKKLVSST